jgi:hypothetical protein
VKWILLFCLVAALALRATLGAEGGSVGAWLSFVVFWPCLALLFGLWFADSVKVWRAGASMPMARWALASLCVMALFVGGFATRYVFFAAGLTLVVLLVRGWRSSMRST